MADVDKFSERLIDLAERFADVTDAAQGRGNRRGGTIRARWLVLPAAGAGLYALGASGSLARQAKTVVTQAKERATDLPDDLMSRVNQATRKSGSRQRSSQPTRTTQKRTAQRSKTRSSRSTGRTSSRAGGRARSKTAG
jgi:hypothetical protein